MSTSWPSTVSSELQLPDGEADDWLTDLAAVPAPSGNPVPTPAEVTDRMQRLGADPADIQAILRILPDCERPGVQWAIGRCRRQLTDSMGDLAAHVPGWPSLPGEFGRYFYAVVFLATVPDVRRFHAAHGIEDATSWESLADMSQQLRVHRRIFGAGGLHTQEWLKLPFRGLLYSLGRLQFNFSRFRLDGAPDVPIGKGELVIGTHIPEIGPLDPEECRESFRRAGEFFQRHFPEPAIRYAT
ncbi:MAG TPA: acyltransferase domain-containing protein, partial [Mycobacteriales bacterium]|nr:acyltransferase domain-containing protein [Mycobacteriales bacterium]